MTLENPQYVEGCSLIGAVHQIVTRWHHNETLTLALKINLVKVRFSVPNSYDNYRP